MASENVVRFRIANNRNQENKRLSLPSNFDDREENRNDYEELKRRYALLQDEIVGVRVENRMLTNRLSLLQAEKNRIETELRDFKDVNFDFRYFRDQLEHFESMVLEQLQKLDKPPFLAQGERHFLRQLASEIADRKQALIPAPPRKKQEKDSHRKRPALIYKNVPTFKDAGNF